MPEIKWNGKLHRPMKFGEGMQPGTVEHEREKLRRRAQAEYWREVKRQMEPSESEGFIGRFFKAIFRMR
jgi:hypothetical protein